MGRGEGSSQSGSDERGSTRSGDQRKSSSRDPDTLVVRLSEKVNHDGALSISDHLRAVRLLCQLRDHLTTTHTPFSATSRVRLLCCGVSLHRRFAVGDCSGAVSVEGQDDDEDAMQTGANVSSEDAEESRVLVRRTATRIFGLLCMDERLRRAQRKEHGQEQEQDLAQRLDDGLSLESEQDRQAQDAVASVGLVSLWDVSRPPRKRRKRRKQDGRAAEPADDEEDEGDGEPEEADEDEETRAKWEEVLKAVPGNAELARHALRLGVSFLDDEVWTALDGMMPVFFRASGASMVEGLLLDGSDPDADFATLGSASAAAGGVEREEKLLGIVQAAESEAGQSVMRDMMLSFLLPASHLDVRRTLLLTRAASTRAGVDHPKHVQRAHDVAMAGTEWIWKNGTSVLERSCCLLTGLAVLTTKGVKDPIRKMDAFCGKVQLPFLDTAAPDRGGLRMTLIPHSRRWILYKVSSKSGRTTVVFSQRDFEGLCSACIQFVEALKR